MTPPALPHEKPFAEVLEHYKLHVSILKRGYEQEKYRIAQLARSFLGGKTIGSITSVDIATYRDQRLTEAHPRTGKPVSNATVRLEMSLLSDVFKLSIIEWGFAKENPVTAVRKPKPPPGRDRRLTAREERRILRYCHAHKNPALFSIVLLALETAMRQGEILGLRWEHVNLKTRVAHLPMTKNGSKRDVPLSAKARDALVRLDVKTSGRVFNYSSSGIKSSWRYMLEQLGIQDLHFHDLRHEAVSRLFELGTLDMMEVAAISGHKSLSMLKRYTHLKAAKIARKLEGNRHRGRQALLDVLIPYPALVTEGEAETSVQILDFDGLTETAQTKDEAIKKASASLLMTLLARIKSASPIPPPDHYLDPVNDALVVMLDPWSHAANLDGMGV